MARRPDPAPRLTRADLDALVEGLDVAARVATDPVRFPRRYADVADRELAGFIAAAFAYGRVDLFGRVLERLFARMDAAGGPAAYVRTFDADAEREALAPLYYRFYRADDLVLLFATLRRLTADARLEDHLGAPDALGPALDAFAVAFRRECAAAAAALGVEVGGGARYLITAPSEGSACKRQVMWARWMVRKDAVDPGGWTALRPAQLALPLDTHTLRISRLVGLTARTDGSWRTVLEVTRALAAFDADDPVRFDFALAHLGISGACVGRRDPQICPLCPLEGVCTAE